MDDLAECAANAAIFHEIQGFQRVLAQGGNCLCIDSGLLRTYIFFDKVTRPICAVKSCRQEANAGILRCAQKDNEEDATATARTSYGKSKNKQRQKQMQEVLRCAQNDGVKGIAAARIAASRRRGFLRFAAE